MNVESIGQPSGVGGESRANDQSDSGGDFSGVLLGAIDEDGASGNRESSQDAGSEEDAAQFAEGETSEDRTESEEATSEGSAEAGSEGDAETSAEEAAAASAQVAAESGVAGGVVGIQQALNRTGLGASGSAEGEAAETALDAEGQRAGNRGELPTEEGTDLSTVGEEDGLGTAAVSENNGALAEGVANPGEGPAVDEIAASSQAVALAEGSDENASSDSARGTDGAAAGELAAVQNANQDSAQPRGEDAGTRSDPSEGSQDFSQNGREGSQDPRDQADQHAQSLAESGSEQAAAAYVAAASTSRADEVVAVENGVPITAPVVSSESTAGTTAATAPTATAPQPAVASDAIAVQTEWLATRGGGSARLRLSPAELGEIEIRVSLRGGVVDVVMVAQEAVTQAIAEEQAERLSQAFSNRDLRMDSFDVRRGDPEAALGDAPEEFAQSSSEGEERSERDSEAERGRETGGINQASAGAATSAPVAPQIIATGPEASVDLRI